MLTNNACRDSSRAISGAMRKSRYWALKKYNETVDSLRRSSTGFTSNDDLEDVHISSSCFVKMYGRYGRLSGST